MKISKCIKCEHLFFKKEQKNNHCYKDDVVLVKTITPLLGAGTNCKHFIPRKIKDRITPIELFCNYVTKVGKFDITMKIFYDETLWDIFDFYATELNEGEFNGRDLCKPTKPNNITPQKIEKLFNEDIVDLENAFISDKKTIFSLTYGILRVSIKKWYVERFI